MTDKDEAARERELASLISGNPWRMEVLKQLRAEDPEAWIAAGFVRNLVWDSRFGNGKAYPLEDVDVLIMDRSMVDQKAPERRLEAALKWREPTVPWSVKNQARMHLRNGDKPYRDIVDAMRYWLESATGIAVRLRTNGVLEIDSAYGLADLMHGILRPTASGLARPDQLQSRIKAKEWKTRWPGVRSLLEKDVTP